MSVGRVLVVDDEAANRALLEAILEPAGYQCVTVVDGLEALAALAREEFHVVLLDAMMPRLDGFAACAQMRARWPTLPVVMVTALSDRAARIRAIDVGADEVLVKPIDDVELLLRLRNLLRAAESHARRRAAEAGAERERAAASSARETARIYEHVRHGVIAFDREARIVEFNPAAAELLGGAPEAMRGRRTRELVQPLDEHGAPLPPEHSPTATVLATRAPFRGERRIVRADGEERWLQLDAIPLVDDAGAVERVVVTLFDVTERRHAQAEVARSEARLRSAYHSVAFAVVVFDHELRVLDLNRAAEVVLEMPLALARGRRLSELVDLRAEDGRAFSAPQPSEVLRRPLRDMTGVVVRADGERRWLRGDLCAIPADPDGRLVGSFVDVTEQRRMYDQLLLSDRLAAVGTMAAGVAHEINNPLGALLANLELAREAVLRQTGPRLAMSEAADMLNDAVDAGRRVRNVVRDLKVLSRVSDDSTAPIDVRAVIESTLRMAHNEIRHRARLIKELAPVPLVEANESRLGQVFLNLLVNAAQAIPEGALEHNFVRVVTRVDRAGRVVVEISDSGCGISAAVQKRMFDPFFTTKPVGVGTGLGLSISEGIVRAFSGDISCESEVGVGTTFRVTLPASAVRALTPHAPPLLASERRAKVLIVDDDLPVAQALARVLDARHDVAVCTRAAQALARIAGERFDLILCDVMMPEMTGMQLYDELSQRHPELVERVVFMTGGAFTPTARQFLDRVPNTHLEKPIEMAALRALVQRMLEAEAPAALAGR